MRIPRVQRGRQGWRQSVRQRQQAISHHAAELEGGPLHALSVEQPPLLLAKLQRQQFGAQVLGPGTANGDRRELDGWYRRHFSTNPLDRPLWCSSSSTDLSTLHPGARAVDSLADDGIKVRSQAIEQHLRSAISTTSKEAS